MNWNKYLLKIPNILTLLVAISLKGLFVVYAGIKRNKNLGMCFYQKGQNLTFIAEGSIEILSLFIIAYLMISLAEIVSHRNLSGKFNLISIYKKIQ